MLFKDTLNFWKIFYYICEINTVPFIISFPFLSPHPQTKISCRLISSRNDAYWNAVRCLLQDNTMLRENKRCREGGLGCNN